MLRQLISAVRTGVETRVAAVRTGVENRVNDMVNSATPENVGRRPGQSIPVWHLTDAEDRALADEMDRSFGNANGGLSLDEVASWKKAMVARIEAQRLELDKHLPGTGSHTDVAQMIHRWEAKVAKADQFAAEIRRADRRVLQSLASVVQRESGGALKAVAGLMTDAAGQFASQLQLQVKADVGGRKS
jgi:hypothetical protein